MSDADINDGFPDPDQAMPPGLATQMAMGKDGVTDWLILQTASAADSCEGSILVATLGLADFGGPRQVKVYAVEDVVGVYLAGDLVESGPSDQQPRLLHRAVKLYNAEVASL